MRFTTHSISLAILLALLVGHASVAVHAATHGSGDTAECELCITYNDSSDALDARHEHGVLPVLDSRVLSAASVWHAPQLATSVHQRGPPVIH